MLFFLLFQTLNFAQAQVFYISGDAGISAASGPYQSQETGVSFGGRIGWLFYQHIGLGAMAHYYQSNKDNESMGHYPLMAEVSFYPKQSPLEASAFFISGLFGTTKIKYDLGTSEGTNNQTAFGMAAGYSFFLQPRYSIGPEARYLFIFDNQTYTFWSVLLSVRMWF